MRTSKPRRIAIIGGGLAGLSAAYHLPRTLNVAMFERTEAIGGRVRTASTFGGEEGAEFLLHSEKGIRRLVAKLRLRCDEIHDWSWIRFRGRWASGSFESMAREVLPRRSAERVKRVLDLAPHYARYPGVRADRWLRKKLRGDDEAMSFIEMILAGETCAPLNHVTVRLVLGCLYPDRWYRVRGGSQRLATTLLANCRLMLKLRVRVHSVRETAGSVAVRWTGPGGDRRETFDGVIIATPDGERLAGKRTRGHFHGYVNVLLKYHRAWWNDESPSLRRAFVAGFYTDGPLNYVQQASGTGRGSRTLRILFPCAENGRGSSSSRTIDACVAGLREISSLTEEPTRSLITRWPKGLPCGGRMEKAGQVGKRVHLAGDRFGEWPSMNAAIVSGREAARLLMAGL